MSEINLALPDMITEMDMKSFATHSLNDPRILRILSSAMQAIDPINAVKKHLPILNGNVYGLGIGKASIPMLTALAESYPLSGALVISKHASPASSSLSATSNLFPVILGNHPIPGIDSLRAGERALQFVSSLNEDDALVCLISGGGSALMIAPHVPLEDLQTLTSMLLACGATINEINTLRRALDRVKGGGLARATKAKVISLILSDVVGNPLEVIASGPTYPNPTTNDDALKILKKYGIEQQIPDSIANFLFSSLRVAQTRHEAIPNVAAKIASRRLAMTKSQNIIVGDNRLAAIAAMEQAQREGFDAEILTNELQGEAREVGLMLANKLRDDATKRTRPFCLIAGGETTVTVHGNGKGGRNQELALATVNELHGLNDVMLISLATDGEDGPTDAAGAAATGETRQRAERLGLDAAGYLSRNDAYVFFDGIGDLIRTGPSGTNVNDLVFLLAL